MYTTKNKDPDIEVEVNFENIYNIMAEKNKKQKIPNSIFIFP